MKGRLLTWGAAAAGVGVLLAALAWGLAHPANPATGELLGHPAPNVTVARLDGRGEASLAALRGRPVVLNFWASWCVPCQEEAGVLRAAAERAGGSVAFLGVDIQDSPAAARSFQERQRLPYPVGPAVGGIPPEYGVTAPPETFFINGRGVVVARFQGPLTLDLLARYLQLAGPR